LVAFLFLLSVVILCIFQAAESDLWMHLSFGREIFTHKAIPAYEPFVYTGFHMPLLYTSWLFSVIYYLTYLAFNINGVILLKAATIALAFFILIRDSLRPVRNYVLTLVIMSLVVILARHRFVERPDTFMMVFLSFTIFSLNAYLYEQRKYIYALPIVALIWANCHSSVVVMSVPFTAFIAGGVMQHFLSRHFPGKSRGYLPETPSVSQLKTVALVFTLCVAASIINPNYLEQLGYGPGVLSSAWSKQEILELMTPGRSVMQALIAMTSVVIVSFLLNFRRASLIHFLMLAPFFALSFSSVRFFFIAAIVSAPVVARNFSEFIGSRDKGILSSGPAYLAVAALIILNTFLNLNDTIKFMSFNKRVFGFGIDYSSVPENALRYMDKNGIRGRVFNSLGFGGYITWRDFPSRTVFVDPRFDIPSGLLEQLDQALEQPRVMDALERSYGFEAVLIDYPILAASRDLLENTPDAAFSHPQWALVYWDDLCLLYLKKGGRYDSLIKNDAYGSVRPANGVDGLRTKLRAGDTAAKVISELKRNVRETGSSKANGLLGFAYSELGNYEAAVKSYLMVRNGKNAMFDAYKGIAAACRNMGKIDESTAYYRKAVSQRADASLFFDIGRNYLAKGLKKEAMEYMEKALSLDQTMLDIYPVLGDIYKDLGMTGRQSEISLQQEKNRMFIEAKKHLIEGSKAYAGGNLSLALREFEAYAGLNPQDPVAYSNMGYIYFDTGLPDKALEYQKYAVGLNPDYANAHYGLALIYAGMGDRRNAVKHFKEYLRIEPKGYYSRKAAANIESINGLEGKR